MDPVVCFDNGREPWIGNVIEAPSPSFLFNPQPPVAGSWDGEGRAKRGESLLLSPRTVELLKQSKDR